MYFVSSLSLLFFFFFFNDTATTEIYTLSLHDALPISCLLRRNGASPAAGKRGAGPAPARPLPQRADPLPLRSEEHTSELQSRLHLVCRLLLEKKKKKHKKTIQYLIKTHLITHQLLPTL